MWEPLGLPPATPLCRAKRTQIYPLGPHRRAFLSPHLHSQEAGLILTGSTGKGEAGPEGGPGSAEAPATACVISQA